MPDLSTLHSDSASTGVFPASAVIIEDDPAIRRLLHTAFQGTEFSLIEAETAAEGIRLIAKKSPDIVLLDLGLPDQEGDQVIKTIRGWSQVPILILSGRNQENQKVQCLEAGADDYVTKPFGIDELLARMRVALRHSQKFSQVKENPIFERGSLKVDMAARRVWAYNKEVHLTPTEYKLLLMLIQHAGKVVTQRQLLLEVWGPEYSEEAQYLRVYVGSLRKKLDSDPSTKIIITEPHVGYRLALE